MSPTPGTKIAHYEILELVGQGGMGAVCRACDTKLERDVAIKVPPWFAVKIPATQQLRKPERSVVDLSPRGDAIVYNGMMMLVEMGVEPRLSPSAPVPLFRTPLRAVPVADQYAVSGDGQRFLMAVPTDPDSGDSRPRVVVVLNCHEELERLVPTEN